MPDTNTNTNTNITNTHHADDAEAQNPRESEVFDRIWAKWAGWTAEERVLLLEEQPEFDSDNTEDWSDDLTLADLCGSEVGA